MGNWYGTKFDFERKAYKLRQRSKRKGLNCNISASYLEQVYQRYSMGCPACGVCFCKPSEKTDSGTLKGACPTVDRIDADLGYIIGNLQILCNNCNGNKKRKCLMYEPLRHPLTHDLVLSLPQLVADLPSKEWLPLVSDLC